jgi:hypothetical protein
MSAFICSKLHIQTIAVNYVNHMQKGDVIKIANILYKENVVSVNHRYSLNKKTNGWKTLDKNIKPISLMQLYKLIQCLDYQSCEHDNWPNSDACKILKELEAKIVPELVEFTGVTESEFSSTKVYNHAKWWI